MIKNYDNHLPIYAVVRTSKVLDEDGHFHIYTKQTSNKKVIVDYAKEIQGKYPNCKVMIMTRENAKKNQVAYHKWIKEREQAKIEKANKNIDGLMGRQIFIDSTKR
jgi:hypothetical protein